MVVFLFAWGFLRGFFCDIFFPQEQFEGVFMVLGRRYIVGYNAISKEERKICKTDG